MKVELKIESLRIEACGNEFNLKNFSFNEEMTTEEVLSCMKGTADMIKSLIEADHEVRASRRAETRYAERTSKFKPGKLHK